MSWSEQTAKERSHDTVLRILSCIMWTGNACAGRVDGNARFSREVVHTQTNQHGQFQAAFAANLSNRGGAAYSGRGNTAFLVVFGSIASPNKRSWSMQHFKKEAGTHMC
jgi:hypothetical protein